jgi:probable phosphoglycerate mutase
MDLIIYTDGASRGNPGDASYGYIIYARGGEILRQDGKVLGVTTNNVAEYTAVLAAYQYVLNKWGNENSLKIELRADSRLVIEQLAGRFKIKSPHLIEIFKQIKQIESKLGLIHYKHVPRAENFIADRLANQALDAQLT